MSKNLFVRLIFFIAISFVGLIWSMPENASAAGIWCGVLAPANKVSTPEKPTDCITYGQNYTALTSLSGSSDQMKSQFITKMHGFENGQHLQQVGAAYIESHIWDSSWNNYQMTWEQRVNSSDVTLEIRDYPYTQNTVYDTTQDADHTYYDTNTKPSLVFIVDGKIEFAIKLDCGNAVGALTPIPPPPLVIAYKVDDSTGSMTGPYSFDTIKATVGTPTNPALDSNQPVSLGVKSGSITVSPASGIKDWKVVAYEVYKYCNTAPNGTCGPPLYSKTTGTSWTYPNAKDGYVYYMKWYYQPILPPNLKTVTVKGNKVDTNGNWNSDIAGDTIRVSSSAGPASDTHDPFNITNLPSGSSDSIGVTPDPVQNWTVVGYTVCNNPSSANDCPRPNPRSPTLGGTYNIGSKAPAGQTYNMYWVFSKNPCSGSTCPINNPTGGNSTSSCPSLPNANVTVALPDKTPLSPRVRPPLFSTSANVPYTQYTPQQKTNVTRVDDISTGGHPVLSIANLKSQSYQQAVVDYSPFISGYPYDNNQASVTYDTYYTVTNWKSASRSDGYTCNGTTASSSTCPQVWSAANTGTPSDSAYSGTCPAKSSLVTVGNNKYCRSYSCPGYSFTSGGTSYVYTYTSGGGAYPTCFYKYTYYSPATPTYSYSITSTSTGTTPFTVSGTPMTECFHRGFTVTGVNASSANISLSNDYGNPTYENPTVAAAGGYTATVRFSYTNVAPTQGLRLPMSVNNLTFSYKFSTGCTGSGSFNANSGILGPSERPYLITAGASCRVSVPPLMPGEKVCAIYSVSPTGSTANNMGNIVSGNGSNFPSGPQCSGPIVNEPYFKVFGGDVSAGNTFATTFSGATSCANPANASASIYGWNTAADATYGQGQHYAGSGAQFAVTAPSVIFGVASNQNNVNANPAPGAQPNSLGLSFANSSPANNNYTAGYFGGSLTASACLTDFYSSKPTNINGYISGSQNLNGLDGIYTMSGGSIINKSNITTGKHVTIYAIGNIFIGDDITFPGSYGAVDQIPSLILIVKGNIYISNNVKNLSGIYIAQPTANSSADGYIYDCASGPSSAMPNYSIYDNCGNQLVVNGSFIANKVALMRTGISSPNGAINSSLRRSFNNENNTNTNAAEVFNYGPAFWMNLTLPQTTSTGTSSAGYDSIISLPPIL